MRMQYGETPQGWVLAHDGVLYVPCPPTARRAARRWLVAGQPAPQVSPRLASTVLLLRPKPSTCSMSCRPEVFMINRSAQLRFAGGATVFPGGAVDPDDEDPGPSSGPGPVTARTPGLGSPHNVDGALVRAAVRELFEETGVLLAGPDAQHVLGHNTSPSLRNDANRLLAGELSFGEILERHGLILRTDLLRPWSRWMTPLYSPIRYDTYFFVTFLPDGQIAGYTEPESSGAAWLDPQRVLARPLPAPDVLLPPTVMTLAQLRDTGPVSAVSDRGPDMRVNMFTPVQGNDDRVWLSWRPPQDYSGASQPFAMLTDER